MATRSLPKTEWQSYFDRISKELLGKQAEIEVTGLKLGDQKATKWLPLLGITYDPKSDLVEVALEGLDHLIHGPREIAIDDGPEGLSAIQIVGNDQLRQIVTFKNPLLLPHH